MATPQALPDSTVTLSLSLSCTPGASGAARARWRSAVAPASRQVSGRLGLKARRRLCGRFRAAGGAVGGADRAPALGARSAWRAARAQANGAPEASTRLDSLVLVRSHQFTRLNSVALVWRRRLHRGGGFVRFRQEGSFVKERVRRARVGLGGGVHPVPLCARVRELLLVDPRRLICPVPRTRRLILVSRLLRDWSELVPFGPALRGGACSALLQLERIGLVEIHPPAAQEPAVELGSPRGGAVGEPQEALAQAAGGAESGGEPPRQPPKRPLTAVGEGGASSEAGASVGTSAHMSGVAPL